VAAIIDVTDLPAALQSAELVEVMVNGANAKASRVAPCLTWDDEDEDHPAPTVEQLDEAKLVLVGAIKRWADAGSGGLSQQTAGPFGQVIDTRQRTGYNLWPSEITGLQDICRTDGPVGRTAFSLDTAATTSAHMPWCSLILGATYCSCGADLTDYEYPLFEGGVLSGDEA
jgi:hypothetical protein